MALSFNIRIKIPMEFSYLSENMAPEAAMKVMSKTASAIRMRANDALSWISFFLSTQIDNVFPRRPTRTVIGVTKTSITSLKVKSTDIVTFFTLFSSRLGLEHVSS